MSADFGGNSESKVKFLNDEEAVELFETQVRNLLGISAKEFLALRATGQYKNSCEDSRMLKLLMMVPRSLADRGVK
ncbi:MAG: hypothetical protein SGJ27_10560 [Candidatus Melainabacteria bacterium]|nr:hypothetical protein [Candidatus Melainabacteria bacterium]